MAGNKALKRRKQRARKEAKRKAKRRELSREKSAGLAVRMQRLADAPVLDAMVGEELWSAGIGYVLLSREAADGRVACAVFLVDVYCLGVKNAFGDVRPRPQYDEVLEKLTEQHPLVRVEAAHARKLVEEAVAYARGLGLAPHADYRKVQPIFGDIDPAECAEEFEFGHEGKPFFVGGPHDSEPFCRRVFNTLQERLGPDGFEYMIPVGPDIEVAEVIPESDGG